MKGTIIASFTVVSKTRERVKSGDWRLKTIRSKANEVRKKWVFRERD